MLATFDAAPQLVHLQFLRIIRSFRSIAFPQEQRFLDWIAPNLERRSGSAYRVILRQWLEEKVQKQ